MQKTKRPAAGGMDAVASPSSPPSTRAQAPRVGAQLRPRRSPWKRHSLLVNSPRGTEASGPAQPLARPAPRPAALAPYFSVHWNTTQPFGNCSQFNHNTATPPRRPDTRRERPLVPGSGSPPGGRRAASERRPRRAGGPGSVGRGGSPAAFPSLQGPRRDATRRAAAPSEQGAARAPGHVLQAVGLEQPVGLGPPALGLGHPSGQPGNQSQPHRPLRPSQTRFLWDEREEVGS